jgi:hypothetical protein
MRRDRLRAGEVNVVFGSKPYPIPDPEETATIVVG